METAQNKMTKETLGQLIIDSEETMYHIAKSLLYNDADCADAIQEAIVKAFAKLHTLKDDSYAKRNPKTIQIYMKRFSICQSR